MTAPKNESAPEHPQPAAQPSVCACVQDPFAALPPELRPRAQPSMSGLRQVTCPGCGKTYWTNRATDLCSDCQRKGVRLPDAGVAQEE